MYPHHGRVWVHTNEGVPMEIIESIAADNGWERRVEPRYSHWSISFHRGTRSILVRFQNRKLTAFQVYDTGFTSAPTKNKMAAIKAELQAAA